MMKKLSMTIPYLKVVPTDGTPPDFTSPRPAGVSELDWQIFLHGDEILDGKYSYWVRCGGPFIPNDQVAPEKLDPVLDAPRVPRWTTP